MSDPAWQEEVDRRTGSWLDGDSEEPAAADPDLPLDEKSLARVADLQLVEILLGSLSDETREDETQRIRRVMDAIQNSETVSDRRSSPAYRWPSLVGLALSLLVIFGLYSVRFLEKSRADVLLPRISEVAHQNVDRVYNMHRTSQSAEGPREEFRGRLYLRGIEGFVITCGDVVLGRNADDFWFVPSSGEVIVADDFAWMIAGSAEEEHELGLLRDLSVESSRVPLMQLTSVIQLMQHDYDVTLNTGVYRGQRQVDELAGTRKGASGGLPDTIRLWSGTDSQVIYAAKLSWGEEDDSQQNTLVFELLEPPEPGGVSSDWYNHEVHHSADRPLRRVVSGR